MSAVSVKKIIEQGWYTDSTYGTSTANFLEGLKFKGTTNLSSSIAQLKGNLWEFFAAGGHCFFVSLHIKRFLASSSSKLGQEQKKRNDGGGGG